MKKLQRFLSAVLCIVMIAAMAIPAAASGIVTSPAPATTGTLSVKEILKEFDKDDYTVVEFGKSGKPALAEYQGGSGVLAEHTVYEGVNATKLVVQNISWATFAKSHIAFGRNSVPEFTEYDYMVVKYASVSDKAYRLGVGGWGDSESVYFEVPAGETGWTTSEVLTVSAACKAVAATKRSIISSSTTAETYIGDIVFFKNKADAEEYAKWAPIYLDPNGDVTLRRIQKREENWETIKLIMMLIGSSIADRVALKPPSIVQPFEGIDEDNYYIFNCTRVSLAAFANDNVVSGSFATYYGVDALKLGAHSIWARANANATFSNPGLPQTYSYAVFRYASESDYAYELGIGWDYFDVDGKYTKFTVPAGNTGWTLSDPITIAGTSLKGASKLALCSSSGIADTYVADIVLFATKDDAKQYIKQWNDYYADAEKPAYDPIAEVENGYTRITFTEERSYVTTERKFVNENGADRYVAVQKSDVSNANILYPYGINTMREYVASNSATHAIKDHGIDYPEFVKYNGLDCVKATTSQYNAANGGTYGFVFRTNNNHINHKVTNRNYLVITYATEADAIEFRLTWGGVDMSIRQVAGNYPTGHGEWESICVPLIGKWKEGRDKLAIYSNEEFYLREFVFFENKADAESYVASVPANFNGDDYVAPVKTYVDPINSVTSKYLRYTFAEDNVALSGWGKIGLDNSVTNNGNGFGGNTVYYNNGVVPYVSGAGKHANWGGDTNQNIGMTVKFFNLNNTFTNNDSLYLVTVYKSKYASAHKIVTNPMAYGAVTLADVAANTDGWCASYIDVKGQPLNPDNGASMLDKLVGREVIIRSTAINKNTLDIREMVFISDANEAAAYATAAAKYYNEIEKAFSKRDLIDELEENGKGDIFVTTFYGNGTDYQRQVNYSESSDGIYKGVPSVKITSGQHDWKPGSGEGYVTGKYYLGYTPPQYINNQTPLTSADYKYAVLTYAATTEANASLAMFHWGSPTHTIMVDDISVSGGEWVTSGVIDVPASWRSRAHNNKMIICSNDTSTDAEIYIQSVIYFTNKDDAEAYIKAAPAYYNGEKNTDDEYWLDILYKDLVYGYYSFKEENVTTDASLTGKIRLNGNGLTAGNDLEYATNNGVSYIACKGTPHGWASNSVGKKGISFVFNQLGSAFSKTDDAWMVAIVRSESEKDQVIGINPVAYGNCDIDTIPAGTKGWYATTPLNVKDVPANSDGVALYDKLTTRECILYTSAADVESLDVQRIVFFKTEKAAKDFIKQLYN